ncbi:hypothetical protein VMCG_10019 [Cytospora schulzeri]|uniref:CBM21 domain-containing protein n=1 Tax=Cytospora schulzeri TaxID=448051 RepID=A0A423VI96_9PEZI|nr:hypothetical protein VMCG_10019 [Valsa malicola]
MPYTPPAKSPASSAPTSPTSSRRSSIQASPGGSRPTLPRSASYLTKHRRTPSAVGASNGQINQPSPEATSDDLKDAVRNSIRQSPPPVTDHQSMPKGAVISPPESSSSEDDDLPELRGRRIENLKQLHDAISQISQQREGSPDKADNVADAGDLLVLPTQTETIAGGVHHSFSASSLEDLARARRVSHNRSMTVPNVPVSKSADASATNSEEDEPLRKPQMVRKKSGELVRPALRPASHRRPSSMPGTPTFSKAVHFDSHLEHVRHFLQVDRPLAVSAGSSPVDTYDSDTEYPFTSDDKPAPRAPPFEWEMIINNFPVDTPSRKAQAVRLERVWLSNDHKFLIGSAIVANLAFQKLVTCRFTLDYWKTTSEVTAEYINGQEHWDNNGGTNFQVDFRKKMLPMNGKRPVGAANRPPNGLPKSNRRSNPSNAPRPKSMPLGFDDFSDNPRVNFDQSIHEYLGEQPTSLRLKSSKSTTSIPSDNLSTRLSAPSGQAFANRYDFGASLSAAMQAAKDTMAKDGLQMKSGRKTSPPSSSNTAKPPPKDPQPAVVNKQSTSANNTLPALSGTGSPGAASIATSSYEEIVNKYCFFGSKQSSPQLKDGTIGGGKLDGADEVLATRGSNSPASSFNGSPFALGSLQRATGSQLRQFMTSDPNPYFQHSAHLMAVGASPAISPLGNPIIRTDSPSNGQPRSSTSVLGQSTGRSASPASMVGGFQPFTGTSPNEFASHIHDRFPFSGPDAHSATAIRGN